MAATKNTAAKSETKEETNGAALATVSETVGAIMQQVGGELLTDGLGEIDKEDIRIPSKLFNFVGTDAEGEPIPKNRFFDTIQETAQRELRCVLLDFHKTNEWREFDQGANESRIRCRSADRKIGLLVLDNGQEEERPCQGCPDAQWQTIDGKRTRRCAVVHNVIGIELESQQPFIIRFKKTSLPPWTTFLNKHFIGKYIGPNGRRGNVPLFAYELTLWLKMADSKTPYAIPVFELGEMVADPARWKGYAADAVFFREKIQPALEDFMRADAAGDESGSDSSFDFGANAAPPTDGDRDRF